MLEIHYVYQFQPWVKAESDAAQGRECFVVWLETLDAPERILVGGCIASDLGGGQNSVPRGADPLPVVQVKPGRGRPKSGGKTAAERQAKFRAERVQVKVGERMGDTIRSLAADFDLSESEVCEKLMRFALMNRNWRQTGF